MTGLGTATVTQGSSGGFVKQGVTAPAGDYVAFNATKNQYGWQIYSGSNANNVVASAGGNVTVVYFTLSSSTTLGAYSWDPNGRHNIAIFTAAN